MLYAHAFRWRIARFSAAIALAAGMLAGSGAAAADDDWPRQPLRSGRCLVDGTFSCQLYEYSYGVRGVSCTEDCLIVSNLNTCQLANQCDWDPGSGCFVKRFCVELSPMQTCRRWETTAICD